MQLLVAAIDAVVIGVGAVLLGLPLAIPIAIIVFLAAFVPIVGAVVSGALAVLVALVYDGPCTALIMLIIVLGVHILEGNFLHPFITGSASGCIRSPSFSRSRPERSSPGSPAPCSPCRWSRS